MRDRSKTIALAIAGVTLTVALAAFFAPALTKSSAEGRVQKPTVRALMADDGKTVPTMKIVPAEASAGHLGFSPLTGDGSN